MFSIEEFITAVFCCVDDLLNELSPQPIRTRCFAPALSDSEVISMEIVAEFLGIDADSLHLEILPPSLVESVSSAQ